MRDRSLAPSSIDCAFSASHSSDVLVGNITNRAMSPVYESAFGISDDWPSSYANAASHRSPIAVFKAACLPTSTFLLSALSSHFYDEAAIAVWLHLLLFVV